MPDDAGRAGTPAGVFGAELRFYRTRAGLSQKDLAARATVSHDVISKIETGERPPARGLPAPPGRGTRAGHPRRADPPAGSPEEGPQAAPVRLVPAVGRHRSPGHGPALVRAARHPRPAADRGVCPRDPQRPPRREPRRPRRAGSRPSGPSGNFGPNGCAPALVHPRRRRPGPRHRRQQGHAEPALPPSRSSRAPQDHHPGHPLRRRPRRPAGQASWYAPDKSPAALTAERGRRGWLW